MQGSGRRSPTTSGDISAKGMNFNYPISPSTIFGISLIQAKWRGDNTRDTLFWKDSPGAESDNDDDDNADDTTGRLDSSSLASDISDDKLPPSNSRPRSTSKTVDPIPQPVPQKRGSLTTVISPDNPLYAQRRPSVLVAGSGGAVDDDDISHHRRSRSIDEPSQPSAAAVALAKDILAATNDSESDEGNSESSLPIKINSPDSSPDDGKTRRRINSTDGTGSSAEVKNPALLEAQALMINQKRRASFATGEQAAVPSAPVPVTTTPSDEVPATPTRAMAMSGSSGSKVVGHDSSENEANTASVALTPSLVRNLATSPAGRSILETMGASDGGITLAKSASRSNPQEEEDRLKLQELQQAMRKKVKHDQELQRLEEQEKQERELRKEEMLKKRLLRKSATGIDGFGVGSAPSSQMNLAALSRQPSMDDNTSPISTTESLDNPPSKNDGFTQDVVHVETEISGVDDNAPSSLASSLFTAVSDNDLFDIEKKSIESTQESNIIEEKNLNDDMNSERQDNIERNAEKEKLKEKHLNVLGGQVVRSGRALTPGGRGKGRGDRRGPPTPTKRSQPSEENAKVVEELNMEHLQAKPSETTTDVPTIESSIKVPEAPMTEAPAVPTSMPPPIPQSEPVSVPPSNQIPNGKATKGRGNRRGPPAPKPKVEKSNTTAKPGPSSPPPNPATMAPPPGEVPTHARRHHPAPPKKIAPFAPSLPTTSDPPALVDVGDEEEQRERARLLQAEKDRLATIESLTEVLPESRRERLKSISSSSPGGSRNNSSSSLGKLAASNGPMPNPLSLTDDNADVSNVGAPGAI